MDYKQAQNWLKEQLTEQIDLWFVEQCANPFDRFYCYCRPGQLLISKDSLEDYHLVSPQRVSPSLTKEQAFNSLWALLQSAPCLPVE